MRTSVRQRAYVTAHNLPADYFEAGQEDVSVQHVQHRFLAELAKEDRANIYKKLESTGEQREPLVITATGVILNGNRRLAAMRELHALDPERFQKFSHVEVAVLPRDATEDDLTEIETELQIAPDLRLDYGWVEEAIGLRRQIDELGWGFSKAVKSWGQTEKELKGRLDRLQTAEEYLSDYLHQPGEYAMVANDEQVFATFHEKQASRRVSADPAQLEAERWVLFAVLAHPDSAPGRAYDYARDIDGVTARVLSDVDDLAPAEDGQEPLITDDPLDALPSASEGLRPGVLDYIRNPQNGAGVAELAASALERLRDDNRARNRGKAFFDAAKRIHSAASNMDVGSADEETLAPAAVQLASGLATSSKRLLELLTAHPDLADDVDTGDIDVAQKNLASIQDLLSE